MVERFDPQFEGAYEERYQERHGFWRPIIGTVVEKFLECGDLQQGFARVRCPDCRHEFFAAYSCRGRCFCPSCHQKRALQTALWVSQEICASVPHRQNQIPISNIMVENRRTQYTKQRRGMLVENRSVHRLDFYRKKFLPRITL